MAKRHYAKESDRRKGDMESSYMIREDHNAIANLPQEVMMKPYPKEDMAGYEGLDDTIRGIDSQIRKSSHGKSYKSGSEPEMY